MCRPRFANGQRVITMTQKRGTVVVPPDVQEGTRAAPIGVEVVLDPIRTNLGHGLKRTIHVTARYHPDDLRPE